MVNISGVDIFYKSHVTAVVPGYLPVQQVLDQSQKTDGKIFIPGHSTLYGTFTLYPGTLCNRIQFLCNKTGNCEN